MNLLAYTIIFCIGVSFGLMFSSILNRLRVLETDIKEKFERRKKENPTTSTFIDPDDPITAARMEHDEQLRRLNPGVFDDE